MMRASIKNLVSIELFFWYALPTLFLTTYVLYYGYPSTAIYPHYYFVSLIAISTILIKILCGSLITNQKIIHYIYCLLHSTFLFIAILYYSLVFIGLESWKKVITSELILSYASQAGMFVATLNLNLPAIYLALLSLYLVIVYSCYQLTKNTIYKLSYQSVAPAILITLITSATALAVFSIDQYLSNSSTHSLSKEPVALTLFSGKPISIHHRSNARQGLAPDPKVDAIEAQAIANYQPNPNINKRNIILIIADALRPRNMGVYGYERDTTPYLSSLMQNKKLQAISGAHASCNESACGLISIASSRFTHQLPRAPFTIQQVVKKNGYRTRMILSGDHTNFYNLKSLYGKVDSYFDGSMIKEGDHYMNDDKLLIDYVATLKDWDGIPSMFQFHLMSSHPIGRRWPQFQRYLPAKPYMRRQTSEKSMYINFYDNHVLQTDHVIKTLLSALKEKNYLNNALIVVTSDHGESIGEHGQYSHASSLHEEQLQIPLLLINFLNLKIPQSDQYLGASQPDIAPTILHELGIPAPSSWSGIPLQLNKKHQLNYFMSPPSLGLLDFTDPPHIWKYWTNITTDKEFVYDLKSDPTEETNLAPTLSKLILNRLHEKVPKVELE